jgi:hypothetical protein
MPKRQKFSKRPAKEQKPTKSKSITPVAQKPKRETSKQSGSGKHLFKIVNENEDQEDAFNALGNNSSSEEEIHEEEQ